MKNIRLTIGRLILLGTMGVILSFLVGNIIGVVNLNSSIDKIAYIDQNVEKPINTLLKYENVLTLNRMYTNNWVYMQNNIDDKNELIKLRDSTWVDLKSTYAEQRALFAEDTLKMDSLTLQIDTLLTNAIEPVTAALVDFDSYNDMFATMTATDFIETQLTPQSAALVKEVRKLLKAKMAYSDVVKMDMSEGFDSLVKIIIIISLISVLLGLVIAFWLNKVISKPILQLTGVVNTLGKGEIPDEINYRQNNEVGDIFKSINNLITGIQSYTNFAKVVGEGKLDAQFDKLGDNDVLGISLIDMRDNLRKVSEEEKKRSWASEGLAKFANILRQEENLTKLSQSIVSNLVEYVGANQAAMFVLYDDQGDKPFLELKATYAYDRQKFQTKKVYKGQGLVGQCWHEGESILMTALPENYVTIGSGLGDAKPGSILIVPLIYNDELLGIIELASFKQFSENEVEFIEKLGESIAATISTAKVGESTARLLSETNEMTEQLQSQEEELRQQTEELMATQEESERKFMDLEKAYKDLQKEHRQLKENN